MSKKIYFLTSEELEIIRGWYDGSTIHINKIMRAFQGKYPRWYIRRIAADLGLARTKEPDWSEAEIEFLHENYPRKGYVALRNRLKKINGGTTRSRTAVVLKARREMINKRSNGLTMRLMEILLGADHHKIEKWISLGLLCGKRKGTERKKIQGGDMWHFETKDVREFVINNPLEIDIRHVEKMNFIHLVAGMME